MEYSQRNPVPLPPSGASAQVQSTISTVFDWEYALRQRNLLSLYEKGKALAWNAADLDWSVEVDIDKMMRERLALGGGQVFHTVMNPPMAVSDAELVEMQ